jgi:hypothetical protein
MIALTHERCFQHLSREAVARCLECRRFFCRECVTEHEDRVVCAACLKKLSAAETARRGRFRWAMHVLQTTTGAILAWVFFYWVGLALLHLPSSFHEGTVWKELDLE